MKNYNKERKEIFCGLCKVKYGDCIQCDETNCNYSFHVTCGQSHGLIFNCIAMSKESQTDESNPDGCIENPLKEMYSKYTEPIRKFYKNMGDKLSCLLPRTIISKLSSQDRDKLSSDRKQNNQIKKSFSKSPQKNKSASKARHHNASEEKILESDVSTGGEETKSISKLKSRSEEKRSVPEYRLAPEVCEIFNCEKTVTEEEFRKIVQNFAQKHHLNKPGSDKITIKKHSKLHSLFETDEMSKSELLSSLLKFTATVNGAISKHIAIEKAKDHQVSKAKDTHALAKPSTKRAFDSRPHSNAGIKNVTQKHGRNEMKKLSKEKSIAANKNTGDSNSRVSTSLDKLSVKEKLESKLPEIKKTHQTTNKKPTSEPVSLATSNRTTESDIVSKELENSRQQSTVKPTTQADEIQKPPTTPPKLTKTESDNTQKSGKGKLVSPNEPALQKKIDKSSKKESISNHAAANKFLSDLFAVQEEPPKKTQKTNNLMQIVVGKDLINLFDPRLTWYWTQERSMIKLSDLRSRFGQKYHWVEGELD